MASEIRGSDNFDSGTVGISLATAVASTSGTAIDFTGIPAGVKRVTVTFQGVSLSTSSHYLIQLSSGGVFKTSGYLSTSHWGGNGSSSTSGLIVYAGTSASNIVSGNVSIVGMGADTWVSSHSAKYNSANALFGGGDVNLGGELDAVRITTVSGTANFDAGSVNISWE